MRAVTYSQSVWFWSRWQWLCNTQSLRPSLWNALRPLVISTVPPRRVQDCVVVVLASQESTTSSEWLCEEYYTEQLWCSNPCLQFYSGVWYCQHISMSYDTLYAYNYQGASTIDLNLTHLIHWFDYPSFIYHLHHISISFIILIVSVISQSVPKSTFLILFRNITRNVRYLTSRLSELWKWGTFYERQNKLSLFLSLLC